ncbi:MAG: hypothetical protein ACM3MG_01560 [Bacillota bacterium]
MSYINEKSQSVPKKRFVSGFKVGLWLFSFFYLNSAHSADQNFIEMIQRSDEVMQEMAKVNKSSGSCDLQKSQFTCNSASLCSKVNSDGLYMYTDSTGRKLVNSGLYSVAYDYMQCGEGVASVGVYDKDPFLFPEKLYNAEAAGGPEKLKDNQKSFNQEFARSKKVFSDVVAKMVQVVESRRNAANGDQIDSLVSRLKSVKLNNYSPQDLESDSNLTTCDAPNAFYDSNKHSITLCPQYMNAPEGTLFFILAHELGHSMDACSSNFDQGPQGINLPAIYGHVVSEPVIGKGMSNQENPFGAAFNCITGPGKTNVQNFSQQELLKQHQDALDETTDPAQKKVLQQSYDLVKNDYDKIKYCPFYGKGQAREASADWLGSEAVAMKIKNISTAAARKEFAFSATMVRGETCEAVNTKALKMAEDMAASRQCGRLSRDIASLKKDPYGGGATHPSSRDRVNKIILPNPQIQKALECKNNQPEKYCQ